MADIVIVEDSEPVARAFARGLELQGHLVRVARDEPELRQALELNTPDLLLLDVGLPGVDGVQVLRELRQEPLTADLKVAVVSNYTDRNLVHLALQLDALDFIEKSSITPTLLAAQVARWLER